ncbi:MAG: Bax inhibitor-1/YccA family protein, partial [Anaerolineales bacterium]
MSEPSAAAYSGAFPLAADAEVAARTQFITRTYTHLAGAVLGFVFLEAMLLHLPGIERMVATMTQGYGWLIVLGAFMLVSWIAEHWARSATSIGVQYAGLCTYVAAEAVIFLPLLWIASVAGGAGVIPTAAFITLFLFLGLTAIVFITRKDFSFMRGALYLAGLAALGFILCSLIFSFSLGMAFTVLMIALAAGYVLYDTSNVLHHYHTNQHVAASLALFAAVALMFWYVLRLVW